MLSIYLLRRHWEDFPLLSIEFAQLWHICLLRLWCLASLPLICRLRLLFFLLLSLIPHVVPFIIGPSPRHSIKLKSHLHEKHTVRYARQSAMYHEDNCRKCKRGLSASIVSVIELSAMAHSHSNTKE